MKNNHHTASGLSEFRGERKGKGEEVVVRDMQWRRIKASQILGQDGCRSRVGQDLTSMKYEGGKSTQLRDGELDTEVTE